MDEQITWYKTNPGTRFFLINLGQLIGLGIVGAVALFVFVPIGHWLIGLGIATIMVLGIVLGAHALFRARRNWCSGVAFTSDFIILKNRDGTIRRIQWADVVRIKLITTASRIISTVQAVIYLSEERSDNAGITGDAAIMLDKTWKEKRTMQAMRREGV